MIPFDHTSSCGVLLCDWVNEWVATINRTPDTGPTFSSRWHFVFAMLVWNNYQAISEKARYLDGFPSPSDTGSAGETIMVALECVIPDIFELLNAYIRTVDTASVERIHAEHLRRLGVVEPTSEAFLALRAALMSASTVYAGQRDKDGWKTSNIPPGKIINAGYYLNVLLAQNIGAFPDYRSWTPLILPNGRRQKYLTPGFGRVSSWLTPDQWDRLDILAKNTITDPMVEAPQVAQVTSDLTDYDRMLAELWAGITPGRCNPPSMWMLILSMLIGSDPLRSLDDCITLIAGIGACLFHAGVVAWEFKWRFQQARPIQIVRLQNAFSDMTDWRGPVNGSLWTPYQEPWFVTPPFPDFPSGHSTFSSACSTFLSRFFRSDYISLSGDSASGKLFFRPISPLFDETPDDYPFTIHDMCIPAGASRILPGTVPATQMNMGWSTWSALAAAIGSSRIYGGIHYPGSNNGGLILGASVGNIMHTELMTE